MSLETRWLWLLPIMCLVAMLDVHASARRDSLRVIAPTGSSIEFEVSRTVTATTTNVSGASAEPAARTKPVRLASSKARPRAPLGLRAYTKKEVQQLIRVHARKHGVDPDLPLAIAQCESGFRWDAANGQSSARGVFQYLSGTWRATKEGRKGTSVFDTEAHIRMAVAHIATIGTDPWNASRGCWEVAVAQRATEDVPASQDSPASQDAA